MEKNCKNCSYMYYKDISYTNEENNEVPEYICICGEDEHYIGYTDDLQLQGKNCENFKNKGEIIC